MNEMVLKILLIFIFLDKIKMKKTKSSNGIMYSIIIIIFLIILIIVIAITLSKSPITHQQIHTSSYPLKQKMVNRVAGMNDDVAGMIGDQLQYGRVQTQMIQNIGYGNAGAGAFKL
jgi:maltodextrin utilization protein YvdJ